MTKVRLCADFLFCLYAIMSEPRLLTPSIKKGLSNK